MKVGLICCRQTEDMCPAAADLAAMRERTGVFAGVDGEIELVGVNSCGGCPGKRAVPRAQELVRRGADTIAFASCISRGTPIGYACPFAAAMRAAVAQCLGDETRILEYTH